MLRVGHTPGVVLPCTTWGKKFDSNGWGRVSYLHLEVVVSHRIEPDFRDTENRGSMGNVRGTTAAGVSMLLEIPVERRTSGGSARRGEAQ